MCLESKSSTPVEVEDGQESSNTHPEYEHTVIAKPFKDGRVVRRVYVIIRRLVHPVFGNIQAHARVA